MVSQDLANLKHGDKNYVYKLDFFSVNQYAFVLSNDPGFPVFMCLKVMVKFDIFYHDLHYHAHFDYTEVDYSKRQCLLCHYNQLNSKCRRQLAIILL